MSRRFFYMCAGILCLSLAYAMGACNAGAQVGGSGIVAVVTATGSICGDSYIAVTGNGDVYGNGQTCAIWSYRGNIFGGPTPVESVTLGQLKARWR